MRSVGARTSASAGPARSGRPPRETTARTRSGSRAAATSAAAAPVLAPNSPTGGCRARVLRRPASRVEHARGKQLDVEAELARPQVAPLFLPRQQVDEQRREPGVGEHARDVAVAGAEPARTRAVREEDEAARAVRDDEAPRRPARIDLLLERQGQLRRTSSSESSPKSSYQRPTAWNGSGDQGRPRRPRPRASRSACGGAVGTATTSRLGSRLRTASAAARIVAPVASPSSTSTTTRSRAGRAPGGRRGTRLAALELAPLPRGHRSTTSSPRPQLADDLLVEHARRRRSRSRPSPAPLPRMPSLRTRNTSSGAPSARATSRATGTPPRGSPSTSTSARRPPEAARRAAGPPRPGHGNARRSLIRPRIMYCKGSWSAKTGIGAGSERGFHCEDDPVGVVAADSPVSLPGRALDLGCGSGRTAVWLAQRRLAGDRRRLLGGRARPRPRATPDVDWVQADLREYEPEHGRVRSRARPLRPPSAAERRVLLARAARPRSRREGQLLVVGHDVTNIGTGAPGPSNPDVLYTPDELRASCKASRPEGRAGHAPRRPAGGTAEPSTRSWSPETAGEGPGGAGPSPRRAALSRPEEAPPSRTRPRARSARRG